MQEPRYFPDEELTSLSHPSLDGWWASSLSVIPFVFASNYLDCFPFPKPPLLNSVMDFFP